MHKKMISLFLFLSLLVINNLHGTIDSAVQNSQSYGVWMIQAAQKIRSGIVQDESRKSSGLKALECQNRLLTALKTDNKLDAVNPVHLEFLLTFGIEGLGYGVQFVEENAGPVMFTASAATIVALLKK